MSRTLVCVNVLDTVNSQVYGSHCQEWFRLGRNTKDEFILFHPNRLSIDNARNQAAQFALQTECDYLYFVDDDMILSPKTYSSLKNCDADISMALTFMRGDPYHCMAFKKKDDRNLEYFDDYKEFINENGLVHCAAVGFACCLIKVECLRWINAPYFVTGLQTTEDVYFCLKLQHRSKRDVKIVMDTKVPTGHLLHPEALSIQNVEEFRKRHNSNLDSVSNDSKTDRGKEYLESCKEQFQTQ